MFHSSHIHMPNRHRQRTALRTFFPSSSFSPPDSKEPMRRGILFSSVASVLLLVGCILTWLEFNDMFGGKISMTGPLLIAVALLMMLLSLRQFRLARKRNRTNSGTMQLEAVSAGGVTALVIDQDEGMGTTTVVVDTWEEDRPDMTGIRVHEDLAPPSYTDVAQFSCSSNCPSFVSHDDRNEAPPTYEETCGMFVYGSDASLSQSSRRCSCQMEASPSMASRCHGPTHQDPNLANRGTPGHQAAIGTSVNQTPGGPRTLSPGSALLISAWQRNVQKGVKIDAVPLDGISTSSNASISSDEMIGTVDPTCPAPNPENTDSQSVKRVEWGQRSFSSVPSYTCLLSESGEVSAEVYNTSSIISQMLPGESTPGATFDSFLGASTTGPTRSRSTSSINSLRQGVPYHMTGSSTHLPPSRPTTPKVDSPGVRRCSEGSRPNQEVTNTGRSSPRQRSDSNIAEGSTMRSVGSGSVTTHGQDVSIPIVSDSSHSSHASGVVAASSSAVRRQPSGQEVLLLNTQDVQETI